MLQVEQPRLLWTREISREHLAELHGAGRCLLTARACVTISQQLHLPAPQRASRNGAESTSAFWRAFRLTSGTSSCSSSGCCLQEELRPGPFPYAALAARRASWRARKMYRTSCGSCAMHSPRSCSIRKHSLARALVPRASSYQTHPQIRSTRHPCYRVCMHAIRRRCEFLVRLLPGGPSPSKW